MRFQPPPFVPVWVPATAVQPLSPFSTSSDHTVAPPLVTEKSSANQPRSWNAASVM